MTEPRETSLRRRLTIPLIGVALVSVLLLSVVDYAFARRLIDDSVATKLDGIRDGRIQALQEGVDRVEAQVSTLAANASVAEAAVELSTEYAELDRRVGRRQVDALTAIYDQEFLPPFVEAGADIPAASLLPSSNAGRYLQQHYIAQNPNGFDERDLLDDAGDGSGYSAAHRTYHPLLRELMRTSGFSDLMLVDAESRQVVYTVKKRIELGTDGATWPAVDYKNIRGIGAVLEELNGIAVGEAALSDAVFYLPTAGEPVVFVSAAVRSGSNVVGAIVAEVPISALNALMTAGEDWTLLGLENTGEAYVVGADRTLRSESRIWLEDPAEYLSLYRDEYDDPAVADLIETVGSPVLLQTVDNEAVRTALDGEPFAGRVTSYLGTETRVSAAPAQLGGVDWAVVVEQDTSESDAALGSLVRGILVLLGILLPLIALIGWLLARALTRPVDTLVAAAARIADQQLDTEIEDLGRNELGDVGRQLGGIADELDARERAIVHEEQRILDMLGAALPARLVERVRSGEQTIEDVFDTATAVAITIDGIPEASGADQDLALEIAERLVAQADALTERYGAERVQRSSMSSLFLLGLDDEGPLTDDAGRFALEALRTVAELGAEMGHPLTARVGMSAGDVATGVLGSRQLSFGVWGDPPGRAIALASLAQPGQVLVDASVVDQLGQGWDVGRAAELPGLDDDIEAHVLHGPVEASRTT